MSLKAVPIGQARPRLSEILESIQREPVTITKDGVPAAVVMLPSDYESLVATLELLRNPEARHRLEEYEQQFARRDLEWVEGSEADQALRA